MSKFNPIIEAKDDGLIIPEVRQWSEEKYRLLGAYGDIFTTSMKSKWDNLVYLDLFAGAGYSKIKESGKILKSSSMIALSLPYPFTKYIFCEENPEKLNALKLRVKREFPNKKVSFIEGDVNDKIEEIRGVIPRYNKTNTVLSFGFVDPFSMNLNFKTVSCLGKQFAIDFLILLAFGMDANRNFKYYIDNQNSKISNFIDDQDWRNKFNGRKSDFIKFLSNAYDENMMKLGYKKPAKKEQIRSNDKNLPLYHLAFYSKNNLGNQFWNKIRKYGNYQMELNF